MDYDRYVTAEENAQQVQDAFTSAIIAHTFSPAELSAAGPSITLRDAMRTHPEVEKIWATMTPEAARDALIDVVTEAFSTEDFTPDLITCIPDSEYAVSLLQLSAEYIHNNPGTNLAEERVFAPPVALASSLAFDRDDEEEVIKTHLTISMALGHLAQKHEQERERAQP